MYLNYWELKRFPFENVADPSFFYLSDSHEEALSRLLYTSKMGKGGAMLTGDIGSGKTLISHVYMNTLREEGADVSFLTNPPYSPVEFLQEILFQMGSADPPGSKSKLLKELNKKLIDNLEHKRGTAIIVDEAQILHQETLEEARLLLNFQTNERFLLTLVLVGQNELRLKIRAMKALDQRIAIRYELEPFSLVDAVKYIMFRARKAGFKKNVFSKKAIRTIYEYTGGLPRKINTVCDLSLLLACNEKRAFVDSGIVESVIDDLA
jgi:general secretion pathway protein A